MKKSFFALLFSGACALCAAPWSSAVTLRCTFDEALPDGVKAVGTFRTATGISGKGAVLNRGGWNSIYYWLEAPTAAGAVGVCPSLSVVRGNGVSFDARGKGKMELTLRSGGRVEKRTVAVASKEWKKYYAVFNVPEELATVSFKCDQIEMQNPQVSGGWAYPACDVPVNKVIPGCYLEVDPAKKYLNLDKGAFAIWVKTPYLNSKAAMDHIGIFGIDHALKPIKRHPDQQILCMTAWNGRHFSAYRMAEGGQGNCRVTLPLSELEFTGDRWHHIVLNWERQGKEMNLEVYFDGGKIKLHNKRPYGKDKSMLRITLGHSDYASLNGIADDVVIFNRPLTPAEVQGLFNAKGNWK